MGSFPFFFFCIAIFNYCISIDNIIRFRNIEKEKQD
jgi:hypothetical protein